ncbi:hypothetical protein L0244_06685 [bacterium]|nr:hypothetical protein [bacterium]
MDIRPSTSQGTTATIRPEDQNEITADGNKSGSQDASTSATNTQNMSDTQAMKRAGAEQKLQ